MRAAVRNGTDTHPGANYHVNGRDGFKRFLKFPGMREDIAANLRVGDVVERHVRDGDVVRIGQTQLIFHAGGDDDLRRTTPALDRVVPSPTDSQRKVLVELCRPALERGGGAASNREIAEALFVSVETVKTHMRALFDAFEVGDVPQYHKRTELVRRALETGLVSQHDLG